MLTERKPTIEEAREMSTKELSRVYNISRVTAYRLKTALGHNYLSILTNHELSLEEMGKKLGIGKATVHHYRSALLAAGLETRKKSWKKRKLKASFKL